MKYILNSVLLISSIFALLSCKKAKSEEIAPDAAPTNLVIKATVSTDGSGKVDFVASATNATSYQYEFGNSQTMTVADGKASYTYPLSGTRDYTVTVKASNASGKSLAKSITITVTVAHSDPSLVWSDEFDTNGAPDPSKWGYDIGTGSNGWGNNELEYYTNRTENASVQNGVLKITAIKEAFSGSAYTSARLLSKGKFEMKYGRVEVKAKLPAGVGTWPAIWMLGADINAVGWPDCGEIDIMEHKGSELNKIYGTFHYPGRFGGNADGNTTVISNATTEFHVYGLEWTATEIKISVDGQVYHTLANSAAVPFNKNFFFILNVAMGGNFAGAVDPNFTSASMEVDYIRVYQ